MPLLKYIKVKKHLTFLLMGLVPYFAQAQTAASKINEDSSRYIELREVRVDIKQKTTQQSLQSFFKANNASTLEDIMGRLPEISFVRRGPYGMDPAIRTFTGGQINTLVDGMRIYGACTDKMDPATIYIEPVNLENIQVQTGHSGFLSGSSIGGTINLKIADPVYQQANKFSGTLSSGYQSAAKGLYESILLNYSSGKWAIRASGTYRRNDDYRSGGGEIIDYTQFEKANYSFSAKYRYNDHTYLKADFLGDDGWNIGYPALPMDVGYAAARIGSVAIESENRNKELYKWSAKFYANRIKHYMDDTHRPDVTIHMDMPGISKTMGAFADGEWKLSPKQSLQLRADISSTYLMASMTMYQPGQLPMYMLTWPDHRKYQTGASASWQTELDSLWSLRLNGRLDIINYRLLSEDAKEEVAVLGYPDANRNDLLKNLSAQLSRKINTDLKASISIGYAERVPTGSELYGFYLFNSQDNFDYIGNPELKNETSLQAEGSLVFHKGANRLQLTGFYNKIHNYILGQVDPSLSSMTIGSNGVKSYINIPDAILTGVELSAVIKPAKYWQVVSTLRYTYGATNEKEPLPLIPPIKNVGSVRFQPGRFSAQLEYETTSHQYRINDEAGEDITEGYFLLHGRLGYVLDIFKSNSEIQCGVENIFDKLYHEHLDWGNIPRPGRNVYIQVKISF
jgi:iron complex outermembrane receptor protein